MFTRDWKEEYVDFMGLIVALSGEQRFARMTELKDGMKGLTDKQNKELKQAFRERFYPFSCSGKLCRLRNGNKISRGSNSIAVSS